MRELIVRQGFVALLYEDGVFQRPLSPGKHRFSRQLFKRLERQAVFIDLRERSITIKGQEILTADKVAVRISLLVYFKVTDPVAAAHQVASYEERIYEDVQLAARRFLASRKLDAILTDRNEISNAVGKVVNEAAMGYGVEIFRADVKDLVFPGNLREIMNQVLETERRAEAKLIQARKDAEAQQVKARSEAEARKLALEAEREQLQIKAEADQSLVRLRLEAEIDQARALQQHPELLKLRELQALCEMAQTGGTFYIGVRPGATGSLVVD